jgi:spore coat protein A
MNARTDRVRALSCAALGLVVGSCGVSTDGPAASVSTDDGSVMTQARGGTHRTGAAWSPTRIRKFVTALPGLGPAGANEIGQYVPLATRRTETLLDRESDVYDLAVVEYRQRLHPDLPGETRLRGYADDRPGARAGYLGGVIVAERGRPVVLRVRNALPDRSLVPVDPTVHAGHHTTVGDLPQNRIATHLHGGLTPWFSDGTPFQWYTPDGVTGPSFLDPPGLATRAGVATYYYPNDQGARMLWYHDHAIGLTRTNAYSGIASAYLLTDALEGEMISSGVLPGLGTPLVIQDKTFVPAGIRAVDRSWRWGQPGDLWYPHVYPADPADPAVPHPSVVPEGFFDTPLVNGALYPVARVTDRRVRFRVLNGSQSRFWHLNLHAERGDAPGEADLSTPGPRLVQIGNEGGLLPAWTVHPNGRPIPISGADPAAADPAGPFNLLLAPAERADLIVDFQGWAGRSLVLYNDAPAPFPSGDPVHDHFTGNADLSAEGGAPSTAAGFGPNTRTVLRIVVDAGPPDRIATPTALDALTRELARAHASGAQPPAIYGGGVPYTGPVDRRLSLNEGVDDHGRLLQTLGTVTADGTVTPLLYTDPTTEDPRAGATEVWQIYNLSADTHPVHFHLVDVQVIERAAFDGALRVLPGTARAPDPNELGWKETVRANPGEVLTVAATFRLPRLPSAMGDPTSPRTGGHEYVWHCHILEHEEHDMMRPLVVR